MTEKIDELIKLRKAINDAVGAFQIEKKYPGYNKFLRIYSCFKDDEVIFYLTTIDGGNIKINSSELKDVIDILTLSKELLEKSTIEELKEFTDKIKLSQKI